VLQVGDDVAIFPAHRCLSARKHTIELRNEQACRSLHVIRIDRRTAIAS
jgi:hypothetical protein